MRFVVKVYAVEKAEQQALEQEASPREEAARCRALAVAGTGLEQHTFLSGGSRSRWVA